MNSWMPRQRIKQTFLIQYLSEMSWEFRCLVIAFIHWLRSFVDKNYTLELSSRLVCSVFIIPLQHISQVHVQKLFVQLERSGVKKFIHSFTICLVVETFVTSSGMMTTEFWKSMKKAWKYFKKSLNLKFKKRVLKMF